MMIRESDLSVSIDAEDVVGAPEAKSDVDETPSQTTTTMNADSAPIAAADSDDLDQSDADSSTNNRDAVADVASENYDSEPEAESSRRTAAVRRRCDPAPDGPGYVYAFTDSDDGSSSYRVKIAGSRDPFGRLRQAGLFNVDIRLVSAVNVASRLAAADDVRRRLADARLPGTVDWFRVQLDDVLQTMTDVARLFPVAVPTADSEDIDDECSGDD